MSVWLFQANKDDYDLLKEVPLRVGTGDWWSIRQYRDKLKPGHVALFWQSGEQAGIYAIGELVSEPYQASSETDSEWRVDVWYEQHLPLPLLKADLIRKPELQDLDILKREWSKNPFRLTDGEWLVLQEMLPDHAEETEALRSETATIAEPMQGAKLYQERARAALPLLVRQAEAGVGGLKSEMQ